MAESLKREVEASGFELWRIAAALQLRNVYTSDYSFMRVLKKISDSREICILLVHHTRKGKNTNDAFDSINGSTGIMGASDFSMVLDKDDRNEADATLSITGRDIEQQEQVVRFDKEHFRSYYCKSQEV